MSLHNTAAGAGSRRLGSGSSRPSSSRSGRLGAGLGLCAGLGCRNALAARRRAGPRRRCGLPPHQRAGLHCRSGLIAHRRAGLHRRRELATRLHASTSRLRSGCRHTSVCRLHCSSSSRLPHLGRPRGRQLAPHCHKRCRLRLPRGCHRRLLLDASGLPGHPRRLARQLLLRRCCRGSACCVCITARAQGPALEKLSGHIWQGVCRLGRHCGRHSSLDVGLQGWVRLKVRGSRLRQGGTDGWRRWQAGRHVVGWVDIRAMGAGQGGSACSSAQQQQLQQQPHACSALAAPSAAHPPTHRSLMRGPRIGSLGVGQQAAHE